MPVQRDSQSTHRPIASRRSRSAASPCLGAALALALLAPSAARAGQPKRGAGERTAALDAMCDAARDRGGVLDEPQRARVVESMLADDSAEVRRRARDFFRCLALDERPVLLGLVADRLEGPSSARAFEVFDGLEGSLRDAARPQAPRLVNLARSGKTAEARARAAVTLARVDSPLVQEVGPQLVEALAFPKLAPDAAAALALVPSSARTAIPALTKLLRGPAVDGAADALAAVGSEAERAVPALVDAALRGSRAAAWAVCAVASPKIAQARAAYLGALAARGPPEKRTAAANALEGSCTFDAEVARALARALADPQLELSRTAFSSLELLLNKGVDAGQVAAALLSEAGAPAGRRLLDACAAGMDPLERADLRQRLAAKPDKTAAETGALEAIAVREEAEAAQAQALGPLLSRGEALDLCLARRTADARCAEEFVPRFLELERRHREQRPVAANADELAWSLKRWMLRTDESRRADCGAFVDDERLRPYVSSDAQELAACWAAADCGQRMGCAMKVYERVKYGEEPPVSEDRRE